MQRIFTATTESPSIRSEVVGWTFEDPELFVPHQPIGMTPSPKDQRHYDTIMEALWAGWKLLAPPKEVSDGVWDWWLVR